MKRLAKSLPAMLILSFGRRILSLVIQEAINRCVGFKWKAIIDLDFFSVLVFNRTLKSNLSA
jgi:hypothetical protein